MSGPCTFPTEDGPCGRSREDHIDGLRFIDRLGIFDLSGFRASAKHYYRDPEYFRYGGA
jgi:hypothetical protein